MHGSPQKIKSSDDQAEIIRLKVELMRFTQERDILKKGRKVLCKPARVKYAFIRDNQDEFSIKAMCRVLKLHRSGFYAWLQKPVSDRAFEDQRLLRLIKESYMPAVAPLVAHGFTAISARPVKAAAFTGLRASCEKTA